MSIPLIQKPDKDDINTSIIAIKRNIERINMLLGLSNSEEIDTSMFATKDELQQAVTDLQPVDEVTSGNMQSVTSNAVFNAIGQWETVAILGNNGTSFIKGLSTPNGKYLYIRLNALSGGTYNNGDVLFTVPEGWRPVVNEPTRCVVSIDTPTDRITAGLDIHTNGAVMVYFHGHTPMFGQPVTVSGFYTDAIIPLF